MALTKYANSPNWGIIQMLDTCLRGERSQPPGSRNGYKVQAFANAIQAVGAYDKALTSGRQASQLIGIGPRISERIQMYLDGDHEFLNAIPPGSLGPKKTNRRASAKPVAAKKPKQKAAAKKPNDEAAANEHGQEATGSEPKRKAAKPERTLSDRDRVIAALTSVAGIGQVRAMTLYDAGCVTFGHLRLPRFHGMLSKPAQAGLLYHSVLQERVTREQVETVAAFLREHISSPFEVHLTGSYRRGVADLPDIDIVLFHPTYTDIPTPLAPSPHELAAHTENTGENARRGRPSRVPAPSGPARTLLLDGVITPLRDAGLLVADLNHKPVKWQGFARIPARDANGWEDAAARQDGIAKRLGVFVRMEIHMHPWGSKATALLAHTGDARFTRDARCKARKMGMHLDDSGLWRWAEAAAGDGPGGGRWERVETETEGDVLRELGMEWVEPARRNFLFLLRRK